MTENKIDLSTAASEQLNEITPYVGDAPIDPISGIAALALSMALKYHSIATIQDGTLYQQYKLEGKNMRELHLDMVFETAMAMEIHLIRSSERIANMLMNFVEAELQETEPKEAE